MRLLALCIIVLMGSNCTLEEEPTYVSRNFKSELGSKRYRVRLSDPPIVFTGATAMRGSDDGSPFVEMMTDDNTVYSDAYLASDTSNRTAPIGLGPTFEFKLMPKTNNHILFEKTSVRVYAQQQQLLVDRFYGVTPQLHDDIMIESKDCFECRLSVSTGLSCRITCLSNDDDNNFETIWPSSNEPIVEMTKLVYEGIYAVTESGQLFHITRDKKQVLPPKQIHKNLKFVANHQGRYFINALSMEACMKTQSQEVYCAEESALQSHSQMYGLTNSNQPLLAKVEQLSFDVSEVAFGGRHFCFLSSNKRVWCKGDNSCGQITGRHDKKQVMDELWKIPFLKDKPEQLLAYVGGTCALLTNGAVQCWGLGASVIRTRIMPDSAYYRSFSWLDGFRPWRICEGGAENGL